MVELPLAHVTLGCPGAVWPKQTSYSTAFQDPKSKEIEQKIMVEAFKEQELDAQILEAIDEVIGEVADPDEKPHSENSNPTVYEVITNAD